jgi:uncharacterized protein YecA (UPF0149 family)
MRTKRMVTIYRSTSTPTVAQKTGRNEKCKCGSGKKAKKCCGVETKYYQTNKESI